MMCDPKRGIVLYDDVISGLEKSPDLTWSICPKAEVAALIDACREKWKNAIKNANK